MARSDITWTQVPPNKMPPNVRKQWETLQKAHETFEAAVVAAMKRAHTIPEGKVARFSYKFRQLHIGFSDPPNTAGSGDGASLFEGA